MPNYLLRYTANSCHTNAETLYSNLRPKRSKKGLEWFRISNSRRERSPTWSLCAPAGASTIRTSSSRWISSIGRKYFFNLFHVKCILAKLTKASTWIFCLFSSFLHLIYVAKYTIWTFINWKKRSWCAWDSNPGQQDGRRRQTHWAIAAPLNNLFSCPMRHSL